MSDYEVTPELLANMKKGAEFGGAGDQLQTARRSPCRCRLANSPRPMTVRRPTEGVRRDPEETSGRIAETRRGSAQEAGSQSARRRSAGQSSGEVRSEAIPSTNKKASGSGAFFCFTERSTVLPDAAQRAVFRRDALLIRGPSIGEHASWVPALRSSAPDDASHRRENTSPRPDHAFRVC